MSSRAALLLATTILFSQQFLGESTKVLLTSGLKHGDTNLTKRSEVLSLFENGDPHNCKDFPDFPKRSLGASGGLLNGDTPFFCGGADYLSHGLVSNKCYAMFKNGTLMESEYPMIYDREHAGSIVLDDGTLMLLGGRDDAGISKTTEFVSPWKPSQAGPKLPEPFSSPCFIKLNSTTAMVAGGYESNKTLFYDIESQTFEAGPELKGPGGVATCGIIKADNTLNVVLLTTNHIEGVRTHIWSEKDNQWDLSGARYELEVTGGQFVTSPDDADRLFLLGGRKHVADGLPDEGYLNRIYEIVFWQYPGGSYWVWVDTKKTIGVERAFFVTFPIPDELADC